MRGRVYLDWNATAPLRGEARSAMIAAMDLVGNPSSVHAEGRAARGVVEHARAQVAALVGCKPGAVIFTSGASESAAAIAHTVLGMYCAPFEHDAVYSHCSHQPTLDVDGKGRLALEPGFDTNLLGALNDHDVVAVQSANSETGVIQDVTSASAYMKERFPKLRVLCDAVQSAGKIPLSMADMGIDYALVSAHKLGGPKGVGALIALKGGEVLEIDPLIRGGGQELGRRSGTENVAAIAGFGAACDAAGRDLADGVWTKVEKLRNILELALAAGTKETIFVGKDLDRLPNTSCFVTPGWKGETQVMQMDLAGFAVSSGSACSSGKVKVPRVLAAMGLDARASESALRVSLGPETTEENVLRFADAWLAQEKKFRARAA